MKLYRFSPIKSEENLLETIAYVIYQSQKLVFKVIKTNLPFSGKLTVCTHYFEEYRELEPILRGLGSFDLNHNGDRIVLNNPITTASGVITHVRLQQVVWLPT
jgi:hypothetical protein